MTTVNTANGAVEAVNIDGVLAFKNIPYAASPSGEARWQAPKPPESWTGVRDGSKSGPLSWQVAEPPTGPLAMNPDAPPPTMSEDCLSLNVWTPAADSNRRPVMVWIHGGAFVSGAGSTPMYQGARLVSRGDVVVVTINYRLGPLGFLNLNEITGGRIPSTGNEGLLDQAFALQWVQDNISAFGGDPNNVTIFGESAGGMSVGSLLALTEAKGLFHKAVPQSGAAHTTNTVAESGQVASKLLAALGISPNSDLHRLFEVSPEELIRVGSEVSAELGWMCYQPCVEGSQLPARPIDCIASGSADGVKVLVGCTKDETTLFNAMDPQMQTLTEEQLLKRAGPRRGRPDLSSIALGYRDAFAEEGVEVTPADIFNAFESDRAFRIPGIVLAETMNARGQDAYQYLITVESPAMGGVLKSCHAIDIGYVFGTRDLNEGTRNFFGGEPEHAALTDVVMDAWLAFAHTGNPRTEALAEWTKYEPEKRSTAIFGCPASVENAPMERLRALWDDETALAAVGVL